MSRSKKSVLLLLLALAAVPSGSAAPPPAKQIDSFLGIKWNTSLTVARTAFSRLKGFKPISQPDGNVLRYSGGTMAGEPLATTVLLFDEKGLFRAGTVFQQMPEDQVIALHTRVRDLLIQKYGEPPQDFRFFFPPYPHLSGDRDTEALRLEKGVLFSRWDFKNTPPTQSIELSILSNIKVQLVYTADQDRYERYRADTVREKTRDL